MTNTSSNILYNKLDSFIKKYYKNLILQGLFLTLIILLSIFFIASVSEYFIYFSTITRTLIVCVFIFLLVYTIISYLLFPILKLYNIKKHITYKQAVSIINKHFPEIKDSLLNSLELLQEEKNNTQFSHQLLEATIEQRIKKLKPYNFAFAVNVKRKFFYAKILSTVLITFFLFHIFFPSIINQGAKRIINYKIHYTKPLPFNFSILNKNLKVHKGSDFILKVKLDGKEIPKNLFVSFRGNEYLMKKNENNIFTHEFQNVNNSISFKLTNEDFSSEKFQLAVLPIPLIIDFNISLFYPPYIAIKEKTLANVGEFSIPAGTKVKFEINSVNTDSLFILFSDSTKHFAQKKDNKFFFTKRFYKSTNYSISLKNQNLLKKNIVNYSIDVIPDMYPNIELVSLEDSVDMNLYYFKGMINDDYGFTNLKFQYKLSSEPDSVFDIHIPINNNINNQEFYFATDFKQLLNEANKINYCFIITDNDKISGFKSTKSKIFEFSKPSADSLHALENKTNQEIEENLQKAAMLAHELSRDIKEFQKQNINSNLTSWEKKKFLKNMTDKQKELENILNKINKKNIDKNNFVKSFDKKNKDILEKQKKIDELLKNLLSDEIKDLMKQLEELQKKFDKNKVNQLAQKMNLSFEDLEKRLDKNLEILKRYQIEQKVDNTINDIKILAEQQQKLSQETKHKSKDNKQLLEEQSSQQEKINEIQKKYKEIQKENSELENKFKLDNFNKQFDDIKKQFQSGKEKLSNSQNRKASKSQSENSNKLNDLAQSMQEMMMQNMQQQVSVDIQQLRQILYNLLSFSFDQEELIKQVKTIKTNNPKYSSILNSQHKLKDNFVIISDSLYAISKRTMQLSSLIDKDVYKINTNLEKVIGELEERQKGKAQTSQQFIITSVNNLTLFLSEALKSLNKMQANSGKTGNKSCKKPGQGMPSISQMRKGQQSLKSQLQNMINQLKSGKGQPDQNALNKRLSQMLAQQEIFQQMINELSNNATREMHNILQEINKNLQKNINDIINRNINRETIKRQNLIITRLLKAEKAEYEREKNKKRESQQIKDYKISNPKKLFEYKRENVNFNEILQFKNLKLNSYYNKKYKNYLKELKFIIND
ncbi:MAG: hypothetical protein DRJ01_03395 [Bacteroidetes bacterium]|nr:MAG: hypothetical protein DRJ01_03395 [Bacteroidota bacterium]